MRHTSAFRMRGRFAPDRILTRDSSPCCERIGARRALLRAKSDRCAKKCRYGFGAAERAPAAASELDLRADFHHAIGRNIEELGRRLGVARHERKQAHSPT